MQRLLHPARIPERTLESLQIDECGVCAAGSFLKVCARHALKQPTLGRCKLDWLGS